MSPRARDSVGTFEDLHAAASRMTGLDDFGPDEYHEPMRVLLQSLADEVANAALLLASPLASAVTGVCLDASCGEFHR